MKPTTCRDEAGFSLIELMVAMLITFIISGAIYGLLAQGQGAFRREPAVADRQQNIRVAMDMIQRDIGNAGMLLPQFVQAFSDGLDQYGYRTEAGAATTSYPYPYGGGVNGGSPDALEIFGNSGICPQLTVCDSDGASIVTNTDPPSCFGNPAIVMFSNSTTGASNVEWICMPGKAGCGGGAKACPGGSGDPCDNGHEVDPAGKAPRWNEPGGLPGAGWDRMTAIEVVRYEIRVDDGGTPETIDDIPNLWRSPTGGADAPTGGSCGSKTTGFGGGAWWLVARGVEDLQVEYLNGEDTNGNAAFDDWKKVPGVLCIDAEGDCDVPPSSIDPAVQAKIVRQVRVSLTARVTDMANLEGETQPVGGAAKARRGQLTSVTAPRAALYTLSQITDNANPQQWQ